MEAESVKIIELHKSVTASNDRDADELRATLKEQGVVLINLMSSPGSGKTTLLMKTIRDMAGSCRIAVMEADIEASVDAERIEAAGARSIQVHTDGMCHMDAGMTKTGLEELGTDLSDLIFLENVGNLICPAEFDTGATKNVMILSIPEGDDKPLKYPLMFETADVLIVSKLDASPYFDFDMNALFRRALTLNPDIRIFPLSAVTGEGMKDWETWLNKVVNDQKDGNFNA